MKVKVDFAPKRRDVTEVELEQGATIQDLLKVLSLHPDAFIAILDDRPVPIDQQLSPGEKVKLVGVVSGG
jgi:sulfur carrier protein